MNKNQWLKYGMLLVGAAVSVGSALIDGKIQDDKTKETIKDEVANYMANQAKES